VLKTFLFSLLAIATVTASLCWDAQPGLASGDDAPWCLMGYEGNLRCYYATSQACLQEIAGGSRGFCIQDPAGSAAGTAAPPEQRASRRRNR
jgi:hypothetical protein